MSDFNKQEEYGGGQFSSTDILKKRTIEWVFHAGELGCRKQESIADYTYETDFICAVKYAKSQLWKYTPPKIRLMIVQLYKDLDTKMDEIDKQDKMSDANKLLNKQKEAYRTSGDVLEILFHVVQNSPMSIEFKEMNVYDFEELIKTIRVPTPLKLFSGEIEDVE